jgi:hypothetical protein
MVLRPNLRLRSELPVIKDSEAVLEVVDAIADVRALMERRCCSLSEGLKDQARNLSIHDVANAKFVARRLILAATG